MPRRYIGRDVWAEALERMLPLFEARHRVVVSFSAGKDSGIVLEICRFCAKETGYGPVEVMMRDEEIMVPGTFEYAERIAEQPDLKFYWFVAGQPVVNVFNRQEPYFWVFDPLLPPEKWVRQPPPYHIKRKELHINKLVSQEWFPTDEKAGQKLINVMGLRAAESRNRARGVASSKGYMTGKNKEGVYGCRPIYDWKTGDVWRAYKEFGWDYNHAYDGFCRMKLASNLQRIAPPTLIYASVYQMQVAQKVWPNWFDRVCDRLPGVRGAVKFGLSSILPWRKLGESWEDCFHRECITEAPDWIARRAEAAEASVMAKHSSHSSKPFPQAGGCPSCPPLMWSWESMTTSMYFGDPFCLSQQIIDYVQPEFFRKGAGYWYGDPTWKAG